MYFFIMVRFGNSVQGGDGTQTDVADLVSLEFSVQRAFVSPRVGIRGGHALHLRDHRS